MNLRWKEFLLSQHAVFDNDHGVVFPSVAADSEKRLYALAQLGILSVTGADAAQLLQGQVTCNVHEVSTHKAIFAAMCNPKGRVITTFLLLKYNEGFLLVLPQVLLESVKKRLQMYVLRSKVLISDASETLCLLGLSATGAAPAQQFDSHTQAGVISVDVSGQQNRQFIITDTEQAIALWSNYGVQQNVKPADTEAWQYLDIAAGLPWLNAETSEEYIPQMLNIDKLGGVSFNKGCYTGQEIVARTHYLGKAKRLLYVAQCESTHTPAANAPVFDDKPDNTQAVGSVLTAYCGDNHCLMLVVLAISETDNPVLSLADQTALTLLAWPA